MTSSLKANYFPILFWVTIFASPIFGAVLCLLDIPVQSGMLQRLIIPIALLSFALVFSNANYFLNSIAMKKVFAIELIIIILYYLTTQFYPSMPVKTKDYWAVLLYFGSLCVASSIQGGYLASYKSFKRIERLIPLFIIPLSFTIGTVGLNSYYTYASIQDVTSALDYQTISYFLSDCYLCGLYYLFFSSVRGTKYYKYTKLPVFASLLFSAAICIKAGGRGGFVVLFIVTLFTLYLLRKTGRMNKMTIALVALIGAVAFLILANGLDVWNSSGYIRISEYLIEDEHRRELYALAWKSAQESLIIGHGLGSIWWEVGYYCHNMFLDLLVDLGLIGSFVVLYCLYRIFKKSLDLSTKNYVYVLIILLMTKAMINTAFSGYWLNTQLFWLVLGFVSVRTKKIF